MIPCNRCKKLTDKSFTLGEWVCRGCTKPLPFQEALRLIGPEASGALLGSFTEEGAKKWFHRKRTQLGGYTPYEILMTTQQRVKHLPDWTSNNAIPRVRELALQLLQ
jgi:hypothetical protein